MVDVARWLAYARRETVAHQLPDRCTIEGWSRSKQGRTRAVERRTSIRAIDLPCRLAPFVRPAAGEVNGGIYGRSGELVDTVADQWTLSVPLGTVLHPSDQVVMAGGQRFQVEEVRTAGSLATTTTARLVRLGIDQPGAGQGEG